MSHSNRDQIAQCNRLTAAFFHMSLRAYKITKALVQLAAVAAGIYAMSLGAAPLFTFLVIGVIVAGPELFEYLVAGGGVVIQPADEDDD